MSDRKYLIDTNVFIQAKNFHYRFEFCQGFWDWLLDAHHAGLVYSVKKVRDEVLTGNDDDPARLWVMQLPDGFFIDDIRDAGVMAVYGQLMVWAAGHKQYFDTAKQVFARESVADAFLIAAAKYHGFEVVTQETKAPEAKKTIPLPNAADEFGVRTIPIYDMLVEYAAPTFKLRLPGPMQSP